MHDVITKTLPAGPLDDMIAKVEAEHLAKAAAAQDSAMIERDLSRGASPPPPADEDPLAAVRAAIQALREEMFECALDEVQNIGRHDPNYARADAAEEALLDEVRKLMGEVVLPDWMKPAPAHDNGLLTSHNPDRRGVL